MIRFTGMGKTPIAKGVLLAAAIAFLVEPALAQEIGSSPIYYSGGNVGIGTASPNDSLDLNGGLHVEGSAFPSAGAGLELGYLTGYSTFIQSFNRTGGWLPGLIDASKLSLNSSSGGNVGIGTFSPSSQLHVFGVGQATQTAFNTTGATGGSLYLQDVNGGLYNGGALLFGAGQGAFAAIKGLITSGAGNTTGDLSIATRLSATNSTLTNALYIQGITGNVGIGTTNPQYPLAVSGIIQAKEVLVNTGWSDYVFDPAYRLAPLTEVDAYVQQHHHLPDMPSADEVAANGIGLGAIESKLLAKIEELTLHMIQAEKENRELKERLSNLEKAAQR